jgi:dihydrofolate synthase/folylpolyglutamate synthase
LHLPLVGIHQISNATVALSALELLAKKGFHVREEEIRAGLSHVVHPGRLEMIHTSPRVVVDIAHNFMGASAIAKTLTSIFAYERLIVAIGILHDKDVQGILRPFLEIADTLIFTSPHNTDRAKTASATAQVAEEMVRTRVQHISGARSQTSQYDHWCKYETMEDALNQACSIAGKHDLICVTGSNYTVSEAEMYFSTRLNA